MNRRAFVTLLSAAVLPFAAQARQPNKVYRIGVLEQTSAAVHNAYFDAFRQGLREQGFVEKQNLVIEYRSADDQPERYPSLAAELVRLNVDVILTRGHPLFLRSRMPQ